MESRGSVPSVCAESLPALQTNTDTHTPPSYVFANPGLQLVSEGREQVIRIDHRAMLVKVMEALGAKSPPIFSQIDCGDDGVKYSIKLDVSCLNTVSGERISSSVVEGETCWAAPVAERNAVVLALQRLEKNHRIRINDFSSRLSMRYECFNTYDIVTEALGGIEKMFVQWELAMVNCQKFAMKLEEYQFCDHIRGPLTPQGKIYGLLSENLCSILNKLDLKTSAARDHMSDVQFDHREYGKKMEKRAQRVLAAKVHLNDGTLSAKDILAYVLCYFGLERPQYTNGPAADGSVQSEVLLQFPIIEDIKYSGNLKIFGKAHSSAESDEEAAFEALDFIEKNFGVKIFDYNYSQRKKALKDQKQLLSMFAEILDLAETIQKMWVKMINGIAFERVKFSFEPTELFVGPMCVSQIETYKYCSTCLAEVETYTANAYSTCSPQYQVLQKLAWKVAALNNQLGF